MYTCVSEPCACLCIHLSVSGFVSAGVQNWFATVEKIIINWLMVKMCPGGLCVCWCMGLCLGLAGIIIGPNAS